MCPKVSNACTVLTLAKNRTKCNQVHDSVSLFLSSCRHSCARVLIQGLASLAVSGNRYRYHLTSLFSHSQRTRALLSKRTNAQHRGSAYLAHPPPGVSLPPSPCDAFGRISSPSSQAAGEMVSGCIALSEQHVPLRLFRGHRAIELAAERRADRDRARPVCLAIFAPRAAVLPWRPSPPSSRSMGPLHPLERDICHRTQHRDWQQLRAPLPMYLGRPRLRVDVCAPVALLPSRQTPGERGYHWRAGPGQEIGQSEGSARERKLKSRHAKSECMHLRALIPAYELVAEGEPRHKNARSFSQKITAIEPEKNMPLRRQMRRSAQQVER